MTGGAGFIGSNLVDVLVARGDEVHVLDDLSKGLRDNVPAGAQVSVRIMARRTCASNSPNRGSFRSGSHNGDFFSWP